MDLNNENSLAGGTGLSQASQVSLCAAAEAPANCSGEREKREKKPSKGIQKRPLSGITGETTARVPIPDDGVINYYKPAVPRFLPVIQSADSCEKKFHPAFKRTPPNSFSKGFSSLVFANRDNASKTTKKSPKDELYHSL